MDHTTEEGQNQCSPCYSDLGNSSSWLQIQWPWAKERPLHTEAFSSKYWQEHLYTIVKNPSLRCSQWFRGMWTSINVRQWHSWRGRKFFPGPYRQQPSNMQFPDTYTLAVWQVSLHANMGIASTWFHISHILIWNSALLLYHTMPSIKSLSSIWKWFRFSAPLVCLF